MITISNSPVKGSGIPTQFLDVLLHTIAISELSRVSTELCQLLVTPRAASFKSLYQKQLLQILTRLLTSSAVASDTTLGLSTETYG